MNASDDPIVDLSDVDFFPSVAVGALIGALKRDRRHDDGRCPGRLLRGQGARCLRHPLQAAWAGRRRQLTHRPTHLLRESPLMECSSAPHPGWTACCSRQRKDSTMKTKILTIGTMAWPAWSRPACGPPDDRLRRRHQGPGRQAGRGHARRGPRRPTTTMTTHRREGHRHQHQHRCAGPRPGPTPTPAPADRSGRDNSRSRARKDWTKDGQGSQGDHSRNQTNDRSRNDTRADRAATTTGEVDHGQARQLGPRPKGDPITAELTAMRLLGGGSAYEAYLAFDEITYAPVVVKVLRPDQVGDESQPARPAPRGRDAGRGQPSGGGPRAAARARGRAPARRPRAHRRAPALDADPAVRAAPGAAVPAAGDRHRLRAALLPARRRGHLDIKPSNIIMGAPARLIDLSVARLGERAAALDRVDRHRRLHGARAGRPRPPRHARARQRRLGPGRHAVRGGRRLPAVRRGRPRRRRGSRTGSRSSSTSRTSCPTGVPDEVAKVLYAALEPRPGRPAAARTRSPRRSSRCWPRQPKARLTFKVRG